jgi:hypothetical protein
MIEFNSSLVVINDYAAWQESEILAVFVLMTAFLSGNQERIGQLFSWFVFE